jgi:hypothetical protein
MTWPLAAGAQTVAFGGPGAVRSPGDVVLFSGTASGIPAGQEADYQGAIQGIPAPLTAAGGGSFSFAASVPIGPLPPLGGFPDQFPYVTFYTEPNRLALPIVVELVHIPTNTVVDRVKTFFWDLRKASGTDTAAATGETERLGVQITKRGVDRLEPAYRSTLPYPTVGALNRALLASHPAPEQSLTTDTGYFTADKVCVPMKDVETLFGNTLEFQFATLAAGVQYGLYQTALASGQPTLPFCVKTATYARPANWEVCVGRLDGTLTSAKLRGGVRPVDLEVDDAGLRASFTLGRIDQKVDVTLRDLFFRWKNNPLCTLRTAVTIPVGDATITGDPGRNAWATCTGVNALAKKASTVSPVTFPLRESADEERFDVEDGGFARFDVPAAARQPDAAVGTCGQAFVNASVADLLQQYYDPLEDGIGAAWIEGSPQSAYAQAMDLLLTPVEQGTFDAGLDHTITSEFTDFGTGDGGGVTNEGVWFKLDTDTAVRPEHAVITPPATFVLPLATGVPFSTDGHTAHLVPVEFDLFFSTTTGALNQVLRELSATERMNFTLPSPASGPTLGQVLSVVNPTALAPLTSPTVEWRVSRRRAPFTWMERDPPGVAPGAVPIAYQLHDLIVDAVEPGVGGAPDTRLLRLRLDFLDPDLSLAFSDVLGEQFLVPTLSTPLVVATVTSNSMAGCAMKPHDYKNVLTCDRGLELAATLALRGTVLDLMTDLLSDYPAPQFFDAQGEATAPFQVQNLAPFQQDNRITLYGEIPR